MFMAEAVPIKKKPRPKNLDLKTIRLPLPGWVSIFHRVSGAGLFLMLPVLLWLFQSSLSSAESFETFKAFVAHPIAKLLLLGLIWAYMHHFCAGLRFLALDFHMGLDLESARLTSKIVFGASLIATAIIGVTVLW
jgi:succinate dehydrogenase / fumarate reductase, cytochrome b subunit